MRILHVVTAFPRSPEDGMVPWLVELLKRLRAAGHEVEVFTSSYRGAPDQVVSGIPVHRFRYFPRRWERLPHEEAAPDRMRRGLLYRGMALCFVAAGMVAAWRLCRRQRYDVIHVHWPFPLALFGWAAQRARPAALVTTFYGVEVRWVKTAMPFLKGFLRWAARRSDRVVAISSYTAEEVRQLVQVPIEVIPYTTSLPAPAPRARPRGPAAAPTGPVGGRGGGGARCREHGRDGRGAVRGRVSEGELQAAYAAADAFVLPAVVDRRGDTEGLGVVLLEAMNHRVPVIASASGGITDIVEDGVSGLLVPPGDARALAAALERLARAPDLAASLGDAGYRRLHERFSWEAITRRWVEVDAAAVRRP